MSQQQKKGDHPFIHRIAVKDRTGRVVGHKEVVAYKGLLHLAHQDRLSSIKTKLIQAPSLQNGETAIVHATVTTSKGVFTGIGDANPNNTNAKVAPHLIRMAETRAEARALRKALDIGVVALEELDFDLGDGLTYEGTLLSSSERAPAPSSRKGEERPRSTSHNTGQVSQEQRKLLFRLAYELGHEGNAARAFLTKKLGVRVVKDATNARASAVINELLRAKKARKNGTNGRSAPPPAE